MRTLLTGILSLALPLVAAAQEENQYRMEIGAAFALVSYEGDFNGSILGGMQPGGSIVLRRVFNPYMGLKMDLSYAMIKGGSDKVDTYYPGYDYPEYGSNPYEFSNSLVDLSVTYEYNFWPYGTGKDYRGAKRLTPFIFLGLGATLATGHSGTAFTANVPIGLGLKYKVGARLNLGLEWAMHFSLSDKLDGVKDPYSVPSSGVFKNTDCYSMLRLTLTYSFLPKCVVCNKYE